MTDKEKVERYDALQLAMQIRRKQYLDCAEESKKRSEKYAGAFSLYERGASIVYELIAKDFENWLD